MQAVCRHLGLHRSTFYHQRRNRLIRHDDEDSILAAILKERHLHPRIGTRKLRYLLSQQGIAVGRDRLFRLLRSHDLLILRKRRGTVTTDSRHGFRTYRNELVLANITGPHQGWVNDITYIRVGRSFAYLSLITDVFSRKVIGYYLSPNLSHIGVRKALQKALRQLPPGCLPIHHSDRGIQYCCHAYTEDLIRFGAIISMTEVNHCYENAIAERLNGILKYEYGLNADFARFAEAAHAVSEAIRLYNERRPHLALGMQTPSAVHSRHVAA